MKENKDIKVIIGDNITYLRKCNKWTQAELAEKLNYSDKAISKWERGESTPDAENMLALSKIFNVKIDYFFHEDHQEAYMGLDNSLKLRKLLMTILLCISAVTIATAIFLIASFKDINEVKRYWIAFVWMLPICSIFVYIYFRNEKNKFGMAACLSVFLWTLLTAVFFQLLLSEVNAWMIYLIGVPLEAAIIVYMFVRK